MNTGVEILLQRMKDNPEDFYYRADMGMSRWSRLVDHAFGDNILTDEEKNALQAGLKETRRERFTELVMKELSGEESESNPKESAVLLSSGLRVSSHSNGTVTLSSQYQNSLQQQDYTTLQLAQLNQARNNMLSNLASQATGTWGTISQEESKPQGVWGAVKSAMGIK